MKVKRTTWIPKPASRQKIAQLHEIAGNMPLIHAASNLDYAFHTINSALRKHNVNLRLFFLFNLDFCVQYNVLYAKTKLIHIFEYNFKIDVFNFCPVSKTLQKRNIFNYFHLLILMCSNLKEPLYSLPAFSFFRWFLRWSRIPGRENDG